MSSPRIPTSGAARPGDTPPDGLPDNFRRVVSFTSRGGRVNQVQRRALEAHADKWFLTVDDIGESMDGAAIFGRDAPLVIEIGSGMGESTVAMAADRPEINLLAVEVYKPGIAQTFHHMAKSDVDNVRVLRADAVPVLTDLVQPDSIDEVWLFFPDPWPKARHHKRRIVTPDFVELVASRLRKGGTFRLATDWEHYAEQMLAACTGVKTLRNPHGGWAPRPDFRPLTRFERRGLAEDREIFDLEFVRR
ncbi:tRNA (guanosine(46)-N7)-methyltransferase TrmB [Nakamurella lactea]|uniref:tRNA (guanosine(46)-N7)-methyltransferase TrmB n=1 Tax=Nakamurella lactea TaxID=459515 RepID=UPI0009FCB942|nr:tRNA (guanosine(46)-N7)-methyltransferase TrmB [Nakamurella lactea]